MIIKNIVSISEKECYFCGSSDALCYLDFFGKYDEHDLDGLHQEIVCLTCAKEKKLSISE